MGRLLNQSAMPSSIKQASQAYKAMSDSSKDNLVRPVSLDVEMTEVEVSRRVRKIFHLIQNKVISGFNTGFFLGGGICGGRDINCISVRQDLGPNTHWDFIFCWF